MEKYNKLLFERVSLHHIPEKVHQLVNYGKNYQSHQQEYESINNFLIKDKQYAEAHCQKLKAGTTLWCSHVLQAICWILYWKGLLA